MPLPTEPEETRIRSAILTNLREYFRPLEGGEAPRTRFYEIAKKRILVSSFINTDQIDVRPIIWFRQLPTILDDEPQGLGPSSGTAATLTFEIVGGVIGDGEDPYRARERLAKDIQRAIRTDSGLGCNATLAQPVEIAWGGSEWDFAHGVSTEEVCRVQVAVGFTSEAT